MVKAIFFDVDGTLLSFNTHTVPQSTIDAINEVKKKGIKVIIATGRLFKQIKNVGNIDFDGFVTVNGSYCVTTQGEVIGKRFIPKYELESLIEYEAKSATPFPYAFMTQDGIFVSRIDDTIRTFSKMIEIPLPPERDLRTMVDDEVFQLNIFVDKAEEAIIMKEALTGCESTRWNPLFADINVKGTNKSVGIDEFLSYYNIQQSETMAFGDGGNDIAMLKHAGIGVAMGNANEEVKVIADYVTDSVDDNGVANALRHFGVID